jgi:glycosyltransferase involved in cell wall biosynthesis
MNLQLVAIQLRKYFWYCRIYGVKSATRLAIRRLKKRSIPPTLVPLPLPNLRISWVEEQLPLIDKRISVIIPTRNAGKEFPLLLRKLKVQKAIRECEIIIVDSGSSDDTVDFAKKEGATVIEIPPETFNHGSARNKGAEYATGDFLLFTVQDALPMTEQWLWEMANALANNDVVAVSCAEFPRSDCDLFYRLLMWSHYRHLHLDRDRFLGWDESCASDLGLRANSGISDLAALIRHDVFEKYKYHEGFAEDLELGKRLIQDGHRIGFLYSTRILHSHNRPAFYYLKRGYVDSRFRNEVFPGAYIEIASDKTLVQDIGAMYERTKSVSHTISSLKSPQKVGGLIDRIRSLYLQESQDLIVQEGSVEDARLDEFIRSVTSKGETLKPEYNAKKNMILPHLLAHVAELETYLSGIYQSLEADLIGEVASALGKMVALHAGNHLGYWYATALASRSHDPGLAEMTKALESGV